MGRDALNSSIFRHHEHFFHSIHTSTPTSSTSKRYNQSTVSHKIQPPYFHKAGRGELCVYPIHKRRPKKKLLSRKGLTDIQNQWYPTIMYGNLSHINYFSQTLLTSLDKYQQAALKRHILLFPQIIAPSFHKP